MAARWIELLEAGHDEQFIDEAMLPEDYDRLVAGTTRQEVIDAFREEKHDAAVRALRQVQRARPSAITEHDGDDVVTFHTRDRKVTFVVRGSQVFLKDD